ncbi:hypothetical protein [Bacillus sp. FJAT-44742]|uniref:hypothetical protein n=1 Tax=Bacillus sp. FJAT-44742 TaxID=2014005 RepID=UPI000C241593|nr:hypothetical protein [Bacillus sp. FJAT-44742]
MNAKASNHTIRNQQQAYAACPKCGKEELLLILKWRYMFLTSTMPIVAALLIGYFFHIIFLVFIPGILVMNYLIAKKKTPFLICKTCRHAQPSFQPD